MSNTQTDKPLVFISYSSRDKHLADQLSHDLAKHGFKVWYDRIDVLPGDNILDTIYDALRLSDVYIIILTKHSVNSKWVKEELDFAKVRQLKSDDITIVPLLFEDCEIPPHLESLHFANFSGEYEQGLSSLLISLTHKTQLSQSTLTPIKGFLTEIAKSAIIDDAAAYVSKQLLGAIFPFPFQPQPSPELASGSYRTREPSIHSSLRRRVSRLE